MTALTGMVVRGTALTLTVVILAGLRPTGMARVARAQDPKQKELLAPPAKEVNYVGLTKCAACHFDQYEVWKTSAHGKAFDILPTKYRQDAECLKCHTTGYGHPTGYGHATGYGDTSGGRGSSNASLAGISCEACHGPGGEHAKNALRIVDEGITEVGMNRLRASIQRLDLEQCINCHTSKAHKLHPPFDRDDSTAGKAAGTTATRSTSFFGFTAHETQHSP